MDALAIFGFVCALSALGMAVTNQAHVKKLKDELEGLKREVKELRGGQQSGEAD